MGIGTARRQRVQTKDDTLQRTLQHTLQHALQQTASGVDRIGGTVLPA